MLKSDQQVRAVRMADRQNATTPQRRRRSGLLGIFSRRQGEEQPRQRYWQTIHWPGERRFERAFIVHGKCADGFTSAGLLLHRWPKGMVLYAQPSELLQRLEQAVKNPPSEALVIADVSPQLSEAEAVTRLLAQISQTCTVTWIDHHAPQWSPEFEKALRKAGVEVVLDRRQAESGASLVASWASIKDPQLLRVADLVRRRDAWTDPTNPAARAWVAVAGKRRREYVDRLVDVDLAGLEEEGRQIVGEKDNRVVALLAKKVKPHSSKVWWQWAHDDVSDVADRLFTISPLANVYLRFGPHGGVSVRTRSEKPIAAELAQEFGGGGHAHAAGFHLEMHPARRVVYRVLRGRDPKVRKVRRSAHLLAGKGEAVPTDES